ncbi:MAG: hypothetical protein ACOCP4_01720 [Candidatus Woesearchaeota archaeon]
MNNRLRTLLYEKLEENGVDRMNTDKIYKRSRSYMKESDLHIRNTSLLIKYISNELNDYISSEFDINKLIALLKFATGKSVIQTKNGYTVMQSGQESPNNTFMTDVDTDMSFR